MNEPLRLSRDPAFRDELGCDLADEALALTPPDLDAIRARVVEPPAAAPRPRPWLRSPLVRLGGAVVALGVLVWLGMMGGGAVQPTPVAAPVAVPTEPGPEVVTAPSSPRLPPPTALPAPAVAPADAPATQVNPAPLLSSPRRPQLPTPPAPVERTDPTAGPPPFPVEEALAASPPAPAGDLATQTAAFGEAEARLGEGAATEALGLYRAYLQRWPEGAFRAEARFGELRAARATGHAADVEALAATLVADPALIGRRAEIQALRAQALAQLGRCQEADDLAADLSRETRRSVRRICDGAPAEAAP